MKKKLLLLTMGLLLISCGRENSSPISNNPTSNDPSSSGPTSTITSGSTCESLDNSTSDSSTQPTEGYEFKNHEYIFTDTLGSFTSAYTTETVKCDGDAFNFMNASHQASKISNVPVVDASSVDKTYVTLLSESQYDLSRIGMSIAVFSEGDVANIASGYYIGMEYLHNGSWKKASDSLNISNITVGALQSEDDIFYFNVNTSGVRKIRIAFECEAVNSGNKIRFGIYSMFIEGQSKIIKTNESTTSISINDPASAKILTTGQVQLSATVAASNGEASPVLWSSSDRYVATIDENGLVKGVNTGTVTITATSGSFNDTLNISVVNDLAVDSYIQPTIGFEDCDNLPEGFTTNVTENYADSSLKFQNTDDYLLTPVYEKVNGRTRVTINFKLWSYDTLSDSNQFAVAGLDDSGATLEEKVLTGYVKTDYADVALEFSNENIVQYKIYYKFKNLVDNGDFIKTGKNYALKTLEIVKL